MAANRQNSFQKSEESPEIYRTLYDEDDDVIAEAHAYRAGNFRFNWNDYLDITLVLKGAIRLHTEEGVFQMSEDMFAVINPNVGHAALTQEDDTIVLVLTISEKYVRKACGLLPVFVSECSPKQVDLPAQRLVRALIASFFQAVSEEEQDADGGLFARTQIDFLLAVLKRHFSGKGLAEKQQEKSQQQRKKTRELIRYIDRHFRDELTLADLAEQAGMNTSYVSTYFRSNTGLGFHEYLIRKRLAYAVYQLNHSDDSILDIALDSGFTDIKPFYSAFRRYLDLSPGKYREALKARGGVGQIGGSTVLPAEHEVVQRKLNEYAGQPVILASGL